MKKEFEMWWRSYRDSKEINSYPSMEEIADWWESKIDSKNNVTYHFLKSKTVVLQGDLPVIHAEYLEDIKRIR